VIKFQKKLTRGLQDISIQIYSNHFFGPTKNKAAALHKLEKMSKIVVLLRILFPRQVDYMLKIFHINWNCTTYRKKIVSRKK